MKLVFDTSVAFRLYDAFEDDVMTRQNEKIVVAMKLPESEWLYSFLLSFGEKITVLEPKKLKETIRELHLRALDYMED